MLITRRDPFTGKDNTFDLPVTEGQLADWRSGTLIQDAMPHLTPDEREFLMTGLTEQSWREALGTDAEYEGVTSTPHPCKQPIDGKARKDR